MLLIHASWIFVACLLFAAIGKSADAADLTLHTRNREAAKTGTDVYVDVQHTVHWDLKKTAVLICDMWDHHWCEGASRRVGEMAPVMNEVVKAARKRGVFIIHAPSDTMDSYKDTPQRRRAQE